MIGFLEALKEKLSFQKKTGQKICEAGQKEKKNEGRFWVLFHFIFCCLALDGRASQKKREREKKERRELKGGRNISAESGSIHQCLDIVTGTSAQGTQWTYKCVRMKKSPLLISVFLRRSDVPLPFLRRRHHRLLLMTHAWLPLMMDLVTDRWLQLSSKTFIIHSFFWAVRCNSGTNCAVPYEL